MAASDLLLSLENSPMLFNPLQHQRRARLLRKRALGLPLKQKGKALKLAAFHQARAKALAANPEPLVAPAKPEQPASPVKAASRLEP
jgi:hypothetical protein